MNDQTKTEPVPAETPAFRYEVWAVRVKTGEAVRLGLTNNETGGAFLQGALRSPQWRDPVVRPAGGGPPASSPPPTDLTQPPKPNTQP